MRAERVAHKIAQRRVGSFALYVDEKGVPVQSLHTVYDIRAYVDANEYPRGFVLLDYNILSGVDDSGAIGKNEIRNTDIYKAKGVAFT